jgi:hypothetical protein
LDVPDGEVINDAGFATTKRYRSAFTVRIPWIERSEADNDDAHWQNVEWKLRKSLALELLGSGKNVLAGLTKALCDKLRSGSYQREPGFLGRHDVKTEPSPPPSSPPETFIPPPTPTLPSQVNPVLEPVAEDSDHVDAPSSPGVV